MSSTRNVGIVVGFLVILVIVIVGVPLIDVDVKESYIDSEPYEVQIPYTVTETMEETIGASGIRTLEAGHYLYWDSDLNRGVDVAFSFSASDTVNSYIFTHTQYNMFQGEGYVDYYEKRLTEVESGMIGYYIPAAGTYYFVVHNMHSGFWGFGAKDIILNSCSIEASWEEEVTHYRTETQYRTVTKYRTITIKVTILKWLTGDY